MKAIAWAPTILLGIALLALGGCAKQSLSVSDYHDIVIQTLNKSPSPAGDSSSEGSGFAAMISLLIGDMDCMGDACINGLRFSHLKELAGNDLLQLVDYRGQLCNDRQLQPPSIAKKEHQTICGALEQIFHEVDAILTTSTLALQLFGQSATPLPRQPAVQMALEGAATNLTHYRENIRTALASLQEIPWLKPALPPNVP